MSNGTLKSLNDECPPNEASGFEIVLITLTLPLWTFAIFFFLYLLVLYLRKLQYFELYEKCQPKNAHFTYVFHIIIGKQSTNFDPEHASLILDLLDNQMISNMTIQVPSRTMFNDNQILTFRHSRKNLRCINFTIYKRNPMKEIQCIRMAHSCNNLDSRLFVYGVSISDVTNHENKFFPITTLIKYRATHAALNTTYESKSDVSFLSLGCDCYDPYRLTTWPTYGDILLLLFYIWSASFFFGHIISTDLISTPVHGVLIGFITISSATVIAVIYLRLIKSRVIDEHFESFSWGFLDFLLKSLIIILCFVFLFVAYTKRKACTKQATDWAISTTVAAIVVTIFLFIVYYIFVRRRKSADALLLEETDNNLLRSNSKQSLEFAMEQVTSLCCKKGKQATIQSVPADATTKKSSSAPPKTHTKSAGNQPNKNNPGSKNDNMGQHRRRDPDTLETPYGSDGRYIRTRNRNSISQYV